MTNLALTVSMLTFMVIGFVAVTEIITEPAAIQCTSVPMQPSFVTKTRRIEI